MSGSDSGAERPRRIGIAAGAVLVVCSMVWGVNQVAIKVANQGMPPVTQALVRSVLASLLLMGYMRLRGIAIAKRDGTALWGYAAGALFGLEFVALYVGLERTSASRGVVLLYCQPLVVALGVHFFAKGDRLTAVKIVGLVAAFVGVVLAMAARPSTAGAGALEGDILCFLAGVAWALTVIIIKAGPLTAISAERVLLYQLAGSAPVLALFALARGEQVAGVPQGLPLAAFLFTVVVVSFASYLVYFSLLKRYQASRVTAFTFLVPVCGVAAGALLLAEPIPPALLGALTLVALGIFLVNRP